MLDGCGMMDDYNFKARQFIIYIRGFYLRAGFPLFDCGCGCGCGGGWMRFSFFQTGTTNNAHRITTPFDLQSGKIPVEMSNQTDPIEKPKNTTRFQLQPSYYVSSHIPPSVCGLRFRKGGKGVYV